MSLGKQNKKLRLPSDILAKRQVTYFHSVYISSLKKFHEKSVDDEVHGS